MHLHDSFRRFILPTTGRTAVQLTHGEDFTYPLYYFIDSITPDGRTLIHHRTRGGRVELYKLDLTTGVETQLTHGTTPDTQWRPWDVDGGPGIHDHRAVLNVHRREVYVFDTDRVVAISIDDGATRELFTLPDGRAPIGQNCVAGAGRYLIYIHADAAT